MITLAEYYVRDNQRTKITETIKNFFADSKGEIQDIHKIIQRLQTKYQNIVVADENDARPIEEQLRDIFGDGPIPEFSNPEFRKKK